MSSHKWQVRPFVRPAFVTDVTHPSAREGTIEVGDTVVLYMEGQGQAVDICVRVLVVEPTSPMSGTICRPNIFGAAGDEALVPGASVSFYAENVFRLEKA